MICICSNSNQKMISDILNVISRYQGSCNCIQESSACKFSNCSYNNCMYPEKSSNCRCQKCSFIDCNIF